MFLHLSYAEYFIARSICLNQLKDNYKYEIERIFTEEKYKLIRIFVNDILLNNKSEIKLEIPLEKAHEIIRFSCIENLFIVLNHIIEAGIELNEIKFEKK